jgi:hypothetical protein
LITFERGVTFKSKDYRIKGCDRYKRMTLATDEFIRRFPQPRAAKTTAPPSMTSGLPR